MIGSDKLKRDGTQYLVQYLWDTDKTCWDVLAWQGVEGNASFPPAWYNSSLDPCGKDFVILHSYEIKDVHARMGGLG